MESGYIRNCHCGAKKSGRIVGGGDALPNEYPWMVGIAKYSAFRSQLKIFARLYIIKNINNQGWRLLLRRCADLVPLGADGCALCGGP